MRNILLSAMVFAIAITSTIQPAAAGVIEGSYIVTFKKDAGMVLPATAENRVKGPIPFGQHSTGQDKRELAAKLGTTGEVALILDAINAVNIKMDAKEAERLRQDKRVLRVTQSVIPTPYAVQDATYNWGLDRLDSLTADRNNAYSYTNTGAGRTIWILDSGLALSNPTVAAEFGGRASIFYDWFNTVPYGNDCSNDSHGTMVASVAGGNTLGTGRGATLNIVKLTNWSASGATCGTDPGVDTFTGSLNWLATPGNAPRGSIVNLSFGLSNSTCAASTNPDWDNAIQGMHNNAGLIVVVAAGNDGCNVADFPMTHLSEAFVVGGTSSNGLSLPSGRYDALYSVPPYSTNTGVNVSTFAPAQNVRAMDKNGFTPATSGTSLAAPYIAGVFAVVCQAAGTYCDTAPMANVYSDLRNTGELNTVKNADGSTPLPNGSTSRFIWQQW